MTTAAPASDASLYAGLSRYCGGRGGKAGRCAAGSRDVGGPGGKPVALPPGAATTDTGGKPTGSQDAVPPPASGQPAHAHVAAAVKKHGGAYNLAPLGKVREHLAGQGITTRAAQDAAIHAARQQGLVGASALEGRQGVTPAELAASIPDAGTSSGRLGFLSSKHAERFSEGGNTITGAEIFAAGVHRGKPYTTSDLDQMVANFNAHSSGARPLLRVPAVLGHEEDQTYLERSDLPAAAWVEKLYREGNVLKADFADVPPQVAALLKGKRYRTISAEVYDEPPEGVPGEGKMLRRVAFLGGDIPQVKSLADIPLPEAHSERFARWTPTLFRFREAMPLKSAPGCWVIFSEVTPMDHDAMVQALTAAGMNADVVNQLGDDEMAEMLRVLQGQTPPATPNDDEPPEEPVAGGGAGGMYAEVKRFMSLAEGDDMPDAEGPEQQEQFAAAARFMAARSMKAMQKYCGQGGQTPPVQNADPPPPAPAAAPPHPPVPGLHPGGHMPPKKVTMQYSEEQIKTLVQAAATQAVAEALKGQAAEQATIRKFNEDTLAAQKKARVKDELDVLARAGKVLPSERPKLDNVLAVLDTTVVHTFAETDPKSGKAVAVKASAFDSMLAMLKERPALVKFGERVKTGPQGETPEDAEVAKVEAHFEAYRENFPKTATKQALVEGFKAARKYDKDLTAEKFVA